MGPSTKPLTLKRSELVVVAGPTASGKSEVAIHLAGVLDAEIVGVDSVHVYRGLEIGSGKVSLSQRQKIPHHMLDLRDPDEPLNVADFVSEAEACMADIEARGKRCLLCGGSSLYLKSLLYGLADLPRGQPELRQAWEAVPTSELHAALAQQDPLAAERIHINDRKRIVRALETCRLAHRPASEIQAGHAYRKPLRSALVLILCWPRDRLYRRIDERTEQMLESGLLEEARDLTLRFGRKAPLQTVGYKQALLYLDGAIEKSALAGEISMATRRLAKQQMTFWRNQPRRLGWVIRPGFEQVEEIGMEGFGGHTSKGRKGFRVLEYSMAALEEALMRRSAPDDDGIEAWYLNAEALLA
ncbi:MAG: tRNA (adenosine(37)-N6)-dimethylallyltransferase MiaA [Deltaproteobacteria bacterium]|nr:tRNA (adenosine(37)-N6)-dimethylallyltransferase MiaA [Deltaproteobacteria bacterium]